MYYGTNTINSAFKSIKFLLYISFLNIIFNFFLSISLLYITKQTAEKFVEKIIKYYIYLRKKNCFPFQLFFFYYFLLKNYQLVSLYALTLIILTKSFFPSKIIHKPSFFNLQLLIKNVNKHLKNFLYFYILHLKHKISSLSTNCFLGIELNLI